jgi:predicted metal-binding protein
MAQHVLFVCKSCSISREQEKHEGRLGGALLLEQLLEFHQTWLRKGELRIEAVGCLCTCEQPCVVALAGAHKPSYLFVDLPPFDSAADLLRLGELYLESEDGYVPNSKLPERLQTKRLTRIPFWSEGQSN